MQKDLFEENKLIIENLESSEFLLQTLEKKWIEIQNGIDCSYILVMKSTIEYTVLMNCVNNFFNRNEFIWKINYLINITDENHIEIYSFLNHNLNYENRLLSDIEIYLKNLTPLSYLKQTLISEFNSIKKRKFNAPNFIKNENEKLLTSVYANPDEWNLFENKIDVNSYNFFEAVHPAYAYQVISIYKFLLKNNVDTNYFIDIGSGPGTAIQMLLELLDSYAQVDLIEPSPTAFTYLKERFKDNHFVHPFLKGFFDYYPSKTLNLAISIGASHHFNTHFLFQHANKILANGGYLLISDEFLSPFKTKIERYENIIKHHLGYIIDILKLAPQINEIPKNCTDDEIQLIKLSHKMFPKINILALSGKVSEAEIMCRELLIGMSDLLKNNFNISNSFIAYYRLSFLELQALVAGLDYEVECKTSVENLISMAIENDFEIILHERIYSTSKGSFYNSGTHLVCFRKNNNRN
ncbi:class I SAM-dependent methyltransferase [Pigmentibacter sp. JX0631]|uniref:class I SAM-dependent methyltransferase n=1 Tax=Pigmentibacter sp. JX0631 TaxID=2976982 RepID=UPI00246885C5|nr:class I SAM-dependent methyltransferase [Pigmentibacter sp. JX0631]WGL60445.1 class I SAM-dependent methyltransferase [Pigmentibacter sp. JX0631]